MIDDTVSDNIHTNNINKNNVNLPIISSLSITEDTSGLLCCHPLSNLLVKIGIQFLFFHSLQLKLSIKFLKPLIIFIN